MLLSRVAFAGASNVLVGESSPACRSGLVGRTTEPLRVYRLLPGLPSAVLLKILTLVPAECVISQMRILTEVRA